MYQLAFGFCPVCGNIYFFMVDADWLLPEYIPPFPCENCFENVLTQEQRDGIEQFLTELENEDKSSNG